MRRRWRQLWAASGATVYGNVQAGLRIIIDDLKREVG